MLLICESNLSSPFTGSSPIETHPDEKIEDVIRKFLSILRDDVRRLSINVFDEHHNKLDLSNTLAAQGIKEGDILTVGYSRITKSQFAHLVIIGVISLIIASLLLITSSVLYGATGRVVPFDFGIVIDAGSTHTEVFLYRWYGMKDHGTGFVSQEAYCKFDEGIAAVSDPSAIVPCVTQVVKSVPKTALSLSPLYLGATGGMRILNISEPKDANLILLTLKYALQSTQMNVNSVSIIQGKDEGVFSWITTNFLTTSLNAENANDYWKSTYGALDLGGASTQFAYALDPANAAGRSDVSELVLYGKKYFVRSKSFLCFGSTEVIKRHKSLLMEDIFNNTFYDPCLPKEYTMKVQLSWFLNDPCVANNKLKEWIETGEKELTFIGASNYEACHASIVQIMNRSACFDSGFQTCLEHENITETGGKYMAFSSFYYVANFLDSTNVSLASFINATKSWCILTWDEQKNNNRSDVTHLPNYCFDGIYIAELLSTIYGFDSMSWKNIIFQQEINKTDVGWSLGYMINATNAISEAVPSPPIINATVFSLLVILSVIFVLIAVYLLKNQIRFCFISDGFETLSDA